MDGYHIRIRYAALLARLGEVDAAMNEIEFLLSIPGDLSIEDLKLEPHWEPLYDRPRFQRLIARDTY